jgi:signal transduction histidine kinase
MLVHRPPSEAVTIVPSEMRVNIFGQVSRALGWVPPIIATAAGGGALVVASTFDTRTTIVHAYSEASSGAGTVTLLAGFVLLAVGSAAWVVRRADPIGPTCVALSVTWAAGELAGWPSGPAWVPSAGMVLEPLFVPCLALVGLLHSVPRREHSLRPRLVAAVAVWALAISVTRALWYDPFFDVDCWRNCSDNVFMLSSRPQLAMDVEQVWRWGLVVVGVVAGITFGWRAAIAARNGPRWTAMVTAPAAVACLAEAARGLTLLGRVPEDPTAPVFQAVFVVRGVTLIAVGIGAAWGRVRMSFIRRSLAQLAGQIGSTRGGDVRALLATALGDPSLDVAHWVPALDRFVDAAGATVPPDEGHGRRSVAITRDGALLGVVTHAGGPAVADLERAIGASAVLAYDNERLRATLLAQVAELRSSRARIVAAGDVARWRIERDLHDGAQQQLLALSFEARLAYAAAVEANETEAGRLLATVIDELQATLAELRDLAHGIFPAILTSGGLAAAIDGLRDTAALVLDVDIVGDRYDQRVEMAAYVSVVEAIHGAELAGASRLSVGVRRVDDDLVLDLGWGTAPSSEVDASMVADRVGALGGEMLVRDDGWEVRVPCVW